MVAQRETWRSHWASQDPVLARLVDDMVFDVSLLSGTNDFLLHLPDYHRGRSDLVGAYRSSPNRIIAYWGENFPDLDDRAHQEQISELQRMIREYGVSLRCVNLTTEEIVAAMGVQTTHDNDDHRKEFFEEVFEKTELKGRVLYEVDGRYQSTNVNNPDFPGMMELLLNAQ